jgi:hypothetical protein
MTDPPPGSRSIGGVVAEELRVFLRGALYLVAAGAAYWIVSEEPAGTVLIVALVIALVALVAALAAFRPGALRRPADAGRWPAPLRFVTGLLGFSERTDAAPPFVAGDELVPLRSAWPILTAAAIALMGLGLVFGAWLTFPGIALLAWAGIGWITQLDRERGR